jgi:hypothetical protein
MNDQLLSDIATSLRTIANALAKSDGLGFQAATDTTVLYANAGEHNTGWYSLTAPPDRRQVTQPATIKGRIRDIKFLVPDGRKFDKEKARFYLDCGQAGLIIIEAGADAAFSKCLLSSLAASGYRLSGGWELIRPSTYGGQGRIAPLPYVELFDNGAMLTTRGKVPGKNIG